MAPAAGPVKPPSDCADDDGCMERDAGIAADTLPVTVPGPSGPRTLAPGPLSDIAPDCRHYVGDRPCRHNRLCRDCPHYDPYAERLCVIKLAALGDVIRTLSILPGLRRRHPRAQITWVSRAGGCRMIDGHPLIDRIVPFEHAALLGLTRESFDAVINLDKEPGPCGLAMALHTDTRLGITMSRWGTPVPAGPEAEDYFKLGLCDDLKFNANTKCYARLVCEAIGLGYRGERYELPRRPELTRRVHAALAADGWCPDEPTVGINVGAATTFVNKMWRPGRIIDAIVGLRLERPGAQVLLLGGPRERPLLDAVFTGLPGHGPSPVFEAGTDHDEPSFAAVVDACDVLFTGDTMAMHVAIALGKWVAVFFGPTCAQEIELYGRGEKLVAPVGCAPCYKRVCDHADQCLDAVPVQAAVSAMVRGLDAVRGRTLPRSARPRRAG